MISLPAEARSITKMSVCADGRVKRSTRAKINAPGIVQTRPKRTILVRYSATPHYFGASAVPVDFEMP
jgi:hypothetical protein